MRRLIIFLPVVLILAMGLRFIAGELSAVVENRLAQSAEVTRAALDAGWARLSVDGLVLTLRGEAPSPEDHLLMITALGRNMPLAIVRSEAEIGLGPPARKAPMRVEFMRHEDAVTIIGRFAGPRLRAETLITLADALPDVAIQDFSGTDAGPAPADWGPETAVAVAALSAIEDAFVTVEPGRLRIVGRVAGLAPRRTLEAQLRSLAGPSLALDLTLRVPRRAVLPFRFALRRGNSGAVLERCAARTEAEVEQIGAQLAVLDLEAAADGCDVGLGGPDLDWGDAAVAGIAALATLPNGRVALSGRRVTLTAAPPTSASDFEGALTGLALVLPEGFELDGLYEGPLETAPPADGPPAWFTAMRGADGLRIAGLIDGVAETEALLKSAAARLGQVAIDGAALKGRASDPSGDGGAARLQQAALAVIDILSQDGVAGSAALTADSITVKARVVEEPFAAALRARLAERLPTGIKRAVSIEADLPAAPPIVALSESDCVAALNRIVETDPVIFAPGSAEIAPAIEPLLDRLARVFERCGGAHVEIGGHTDDQGRETMNAKLSRARADAVRQALRARGITPDRVRLSSHGYGESAPVASNDTEAGRALNRRIAFQPGAPGASADKGG
ncbi:MAG: OmpA family protein [Pseudomonadota bacterium]